MRCRSSYDPRTLRGVTPPLTGPNPSRPMRKEEGCYQEGHPSVKVSQSRIMSFNSTTMNARASPGGDAVHTRPSGLTNVQGLPRATPTASRPMVAVKEASWST